MLAAVALVALIAAGLAWYRVGRDAGRGHEAQPVGEAGWPHLRGPRFDAVSRETGLADSWPAEGPPVLWCRELGQGYSGIVAVGDRLFTQAQTAAGQCVLCLDADTGDVLWRHRYDWPWKPDGEYPGPYATPTVDAGRVFFAGSDGSVGCLDAVDGRVRWRVDLLKAERGEAGDFGYACTPLVLEGKVVLPVGGPLGAVVALDARDGSVRWRAGEGPATYSSVLPCALAGRTQLVTILQNSILACDLADGSVLWNHEFSEGYDEHSCWPLYVEPHLFVASPFGRGARLFRLSPKPSPEPPRVWDKVAFCNDVMSSVALDGQVYGFHLKELQSARPDRETTGTFACLDLGTGERRWSTEAVGHASALVADGKLILLEDRGTLVLARATPRAYEELARSPVLPRSLCWTQPALHRGRLYVRDQARVACVYLGRPESLAPERAAAARPARAVMAALGAGPARRHALDEALQAPRRADVVRWFLLCLAVQAAAAVFACATAAVGKKPRPDGGGNRFARLFLAGTFLLAAGLPLVPRGGAPVPLTWPAAVHAAYVAALACSAGAAGRRRTRFLAALGFLAFCAAYQAACIRLSAPVGIGFLVGLLPAWPAVAWSLRAAGPSRRAAGFLAGFAVHFWTSAAFILWKTGA